MKKVVGTILVLVIIISAWKTYKILNKKYHNTEITSNIAQQKHVSNNDELQKVDSAKAISLKESNECSLPLSGSPTRCNRPVGSIASNQKQESVDLPAPSQNTSSEYDRDLEDLVLSEYTDLKRKADPALIPEYSVVLAPKESWLTEFRINGESLSEKAFSRIINKLGNDGMTVLEMQGACITSITCYLDTIFLMAFYQNVDIPHFDGELFSKTIKVLPDDTHLICFTTKENNYGISRDTQKFYVSSLVYERDSETITHNFLEQAIEAIRIKMAKKILLSKLSPHEAELIRQKNSYQKADLVHLLRSKYKTTIYVPDYRPLGMLPKAMRLSSKGVSLRPK